MSESLKWGRERVVSASFSLVIEMAGVIPYHEIPLHMLHLALINQDVTAHRLSPVISLCSLVLCHSSVLCCAALNTSVCMWVCVCVCVISLRHSSSITCVPDSSHPFML